MDIIMFKFSNVGEKNPRIMKSRLIRLHDQDDMITIMGPYSEN